MGWLAPALAPHSQHAPFGHAAFNRPNRPTRFARASPHAGPARQQRCRGHRRCARRAARRVCAETGGAAVRDRWIQAARSTISSRTPCHPRPARVPRRRLVPRTRAARRSFWSGTATKQVRALSATCTPPRMPGALGGEGQEVSLPVPWRRLRRHRQACWKVRRRVRSNGSRRESIRPTLRCWCGCDSAPRLAGRAHRVRGACATSCSTSRCRRAPAGSSRSAACCSRSSAIQLLTGAFLTLYYAPTPDHAYDSVRFISSSTVRARSCAACITSAPASSSSRRSLHMLRVIGFGSYKRPREVTWLSGLGAARPDPRRSR